MGWGSIKFPKIDWPHLDLKKAANIDVSSVAEQKGGGIKSVFSDIKTNFPTEKVTDAFSDTMGDAAGGFSGIGDTVSNMVQETGIGDKLGGLVSNVKDKFGGSSIGVDDIPKDTGGIIPFVKKLNIPGISDALNSIPDISNMSAMNGDFSNITGFDINGSDMTKKLGIDGVDVGDSGFDLDSVSLDDVNISNGGNVQDIMDKMQKKTNVNTPNTKIPDLDDFDTSSITNTSGMDTDSILDMFGNMGIDTSSISVSKPPSDINELNKYSKYDTEGIIGTASGIDISDFSSMEESLKNGDFNDLNSQLPPYLTELDAAGLPKFGVTVDTNSIKQMEADMPEPKIEIPDADRMTFQEDPMGMIRDNISNMANSIETSVTPEWVGYFKKYVQKVANINIGTNRADLETFRNFDSNMKSSSLDHKAMLNSESIDPFTRNQSENNHTRDLFFTDKYDRDTGKTGGVTAEEMFKTVNVKQKGLERMAEMNQDVEDFKTSFQAQDFFDKTKFLRFNNPEIGFDYGHHGKDGLILADFSPGPRKDFTIKSHDFATGIRDGISGFFTGFVHDSIESRDKSKDALFGAVTLVGAGFAYHKLDKKYDLTTKIVGAAYKSGSGVKSALSALKSKTTYVENVHFGDDGAVSTIVNTGKIDVKSAASKFASTSLGTGANAVLKGSEFVSTVIGNKMYEKSVEKDRLRNITKLKTPKTPNKLTGAWKEGEGFKDIATVDTSPIKAIAEKLKGVYPAK